ncbi:MAG: polysaccharide biosynthesis/export family protein [Pseudomonadota bacterium]
MTVKTLLGLGILLGIAGCGVIYTAPDVSDGKPFGGAFQTDLKVDVVPMTLESAKAANLVDYVPPRLPLAFQPGQATRIARQAAAVTPIGALPTPSARALSRPDILPERLPPRVTPQPYRIGVSDVLVLSVTSTATLEDLPALISAQSRRQGYTVQGDGAVAIPDVGRVRVAGQTMQDAEAAIFDALVGAGIDPAFTLEIAEFNSQSVSVGGTVGRPMLVPLGLRPLRLHEAVQLAGGIQAQDRATTRIQLSRNGDVYQIAMERYIRDPSARNIVLLDGDSVFVSSEFRPEEAALFFQEQVALRRAEGDRVTAQLQAQQIAGERQRLALQQLQAERELFEDRLALGAVERHYAYRTGEVEQPSRVALPFERSASLADVLFEEGGRGLDIQFADYAEIYVLRAATDPAQAGGVTAYRLDAENAVNLTVATQFQIRPNDIVFVAEQPVTSWNRTLSQILPQIFLTAGAIAAAAN